MLATELDRERASAAGLQWWVCRCGRPVDRHSRRTRPSGGGSEYTCGLTSSGRFESETLPALAFVPGEGLHAFAAELEAPT